MSRLVGYSSPTPSFVAPNRSDRNPRRVTTRRVTTRASWFQDADMSAHGAVLPGRLDPSRTAVFVCDFQ